MRAPEDGGFGSIRHSTRGTDGGIPPWAGGAEAPASSFKGGGYGQIRCGVQRKGGLMPDDSCTDQLCIYGRLPFEDFQK